MTSYNVVYNSLNVLTGKYVNINGVARKEWKRARDESVAIPSAR
jgi:hypothetical protein